MILTSTLPNRWNIFPDTGEFKPKSPIENGVWDDTEKDERSN